MAVLRRLIREPLVHFLVAGAVLYFLFGIVSGPQAETQDERTIVIDRQALLTFLQYRSKAFEPDYFAARLDAMTAADKSELINQYIREEVLYREARAMGLWTGDYVIRRRMIQKMNFLIEDLAGEKARPGDAALEEYLREHRDRYAIAPSWTFTHVFLDASVHGEAAARRMAEDLLPRLNESDVRFSDAPRYGDRFPFFQNYVERTGAYVASHFGDGFLDALDGMRPATGTWQGPIRSKYGYHAVLLKDHTDRRMPRLAEVKRRVEDDLRRDRIEEASNRAVRELRRHYDIRIADGLDRAP